MMAILLRKTHSILGTILFGKGCVTDVFEGCVTDVFEGCAWVHGRMMRYVLIQCTNFMTALLCKHVTVQLMHKLSQDCTRKDVFQTKTMIIHARKNMETLSNVGPYAFHTYATWFQKPWCFSKTSMV